MLEASDGNDPVSLLGGSSGRVTKSYDRISIPAKNLQGLVFFFILLAAF